MRGQAEDLTARLKPQTTLGPLTDLKHTTCRDICVTAVTNLYAVKKQKSERMLGGNDADVFVPLFFFTF